MRFEEKNRVGQETGTTGIFLGLVETINMCFC